MIIVHPDDFPINWNQSVEISTTETHLAAQFVDGIRCWDLTPDGIDFQVGTIGPRTRGRSRWLLPKVRPIYRVVKGGEPPRGGGSLIFPKVGKLVSETAGRKLYD